MNTSIILQELEQDKNQAVTLLRNNVIPFIPRGIRDFVDHGYDHIQETIYKKEQILEWFSRNNFTLTELEKILLDLSIWFHDVGCIIDRKDHGNRASKIIRRLNFGLDFEIRQILEKIISHHTEVTLKDIKKLGVTLYRPMMPVRIDLLVAILKLSDALDAGHRVTHSQRYAMRAPPQVYEILTTFCRLSQNTKNHWKAHMACLGVKLDSVENNIVIHRKVGKECRSLISKYIKKGIDKELKKFTAIVSKYDSTVPHLRTVTNVTEDP